MSELPFSSGDTASVTASVTTEQGKDPSLKREAEQQTQAERLEARSRSPEEVHVFVDKNGRALPNAEKFAGKEFTPEDVKVRPKDVSELHQKLQGTAEKLLAGEGQKPDKLVNRIENAAQMLELAPEGIKFSPDGRPDFTPYAEHQVEILEGLTGDYKHDSALANNRAGISEAAWEELKQDLVWHHVEDGKTMQLIPRELHDAVRHVGGSYVIKNGIDAALTPASEQIMRETANTTIPSGLSGHFAPIPHFCPSCGGISHSQGRGERAFGP